MSDSLEHSLRVSTGFTPIQPLPLVCEFAWLPHEKESLDHVTMELVGHTNRIHILFPLYTRNAGHDQLGALLLALKVAATLHHHLQWLCTQDTHVHHVL